MTRVCAELDASRSIAATDLVLHPKPTTGSRRRPRRGGGAVCARVPGSTHLTTWSEYSMRGGVDPCTPEPALASFLIGRPRCQGPSPSAVSARLLGDHKTVTWELHWRRTPDVGEDARPRLPQGPGHAHGPRTQRSDPHALIRIVSKFWPRTPEGTRGLRFWRQPHQVGETHKAMGRWEPNLG